MILTKEVEVKLWGHTVKYYNDLGYKGKHGDAVIIKVEDLPKRSNEKIEVLCDYCGNKCKPRYVDYLNSIEIDGTYACSHCTIRKAEKTMYDKYGVKNYSSTEECRSKVTDTLVSRYGINHVSKSEEFLKRKRDNNKDKYGVEHTLQIKEFRDKGIQTNLQKYGVKYASQSLEVKEKISQTFYENSTTPTSKQQLYIFNLYNQNKNAELNYPISYYNVDIYLPNDNLTIEYDGGFHDGQVKTGRLTQEEFNQKEIIRNNIIKREGYKQMRIISSKDKLPSDFILLQMLDYTRNYFSQYPNHSWIEFNIDTSSIRSAEYKNGVFFYYGKLRTIKDKDVA